MRHRHRRKVSLLIVVVCYALLAWGVAGCSLLGQDGGAPVVFETAVTSEGDGIVRWDGNTGIARADGQLTVRVLDKATRFPLVLYQVQKGRTLLWSRSMNFSEDMDSATPLPRWMLHTGIFASEEEGNALGFTFEPPLPP